MEIIRILQISFVFILYGEWSTATVTSSISNRSTPKTVDIAMFSDNSAPGKQFSVFVDSTMTRLIVEVKVDRLNPVIIVSKPSGSPGPFPKLNGTASTGTVTATLDVAITAADYGIWKLTKLDANTWNVKVHGESPLEFSYQFLEGTMFKMPVTGDPIQGKSYTTVITVPEYATIQKVDLILEFVTEKSEPANMFRRVIKEDFMIGIQGRDKSGHFFRRITVIKPIALTLYVPSFAGVKLYENTRLDIPFTVNNKLSTDQDIDVYIKDTQGFVEAPTIISATLKPGQNFTEKFVIRGGLLGLTTYISYNTAKPYLGHGHVSHGSSEVRRFTVESNQTDQKKYSNTEMKSGRLFTAVTNHLTSAVVTIKVLEPVDPSRATKPKLMLKIAGSVLLSRFMRDNGKCNNPTPPSTGLSGIQFSTLKTSTSTSTSTASSSLANFKSKTSKASTTIRVTTPLATSSNGASSTSSPTIGVTTPLATSSTGANATLSPTIRVATSLATSSTGVISTHSTTFRVTTPIETSSTGVKSTPSTNVGVTAPMTTSSTSINGKPSATTTGTKSSKTSSTSINGKPSTTTTGTKSSKTSSTSINGKPSTIGTGTKSSKPSSTSINGKPSTTTTGTKSSKTSSTSINGKPSTTTTGTKSSKTSSTSINGKPSTTTTGTKSSKTSSTSFKSTATNVGVTMPSVTSLIKTIRSSTVTIGTAPASTVSSSAPLVQSSTTRNYAFSLPQAASKTTPIAPANDKNDKGDFFAIISAIVFRNHMNTGKYVAESKQISISESIKVALP